MDPDSISGIWAKRLENPILRGLAAVAVGLLLAILAIDISSFMLGALNAPYWLINVAALIVAPIVAVLASLGANRAMKELSEPSDD